MYNIYIEGPDGHVAKMTAENLEDIIIHTNMYNNCKITIEYEGIDEDIIYPPESRIDTN